MAEFRTEDITRIAYELEINPDFRLALLRILRDLVNAEGEGDVQKAFGSGAAMLRRPL